MTLYDFVLFLHILVAICAFGLAATLHTAELLMRRATSTAELRILTRPGRLGPLFGLFVLLLFGLGSWLIHLSSGDEKFAFKDPFVWTATVVLVFLFATGPTILGRHHKRLERELEAAGDGPVPANVRALTIDRTALLTSYVSTFSALGVVFNMANKPHVATAVAVIVGFAVLGVALAMLASRPVATASPVVENAPA